MSSLKAKNLKYHAGLLTVNAAVGMALFLVDQPAISPELIARAGGASALAFLVAMLLTWLIPTALRESLLFWRVTHVLPGHRAFTEHLHADERLDPTRLTARLGALPTDPAAQNRLWYRLLKKHEKGNDGILENHQRFLFFRDAASVCLMLSIVAMLAFVLTYETPLFAIGSLLLVEYFLLVAAGRNAANRLVTNVLALESVAD